MTGGAERVAHISPPPCFGPSVKAYFLVHVRSLHLSTILLFLSLIFCLCWLWRNRELVWDIVRGKFAKQLLSVFFLPNEVISYVYKGQSICSVLMNMQHHEVVQSIVFRCWVQIRLHPLKSWKWSFTNGIGCWHDISGLFFDSDCFFDYTGLCVTSAWFYPRWTCSLPIFDLFGFLFWWLLWRHCKTFDINAQKAKFYSSTVVYFLHWRTS